ncbi:DUF4038 domain-containing protein [Coraliomargarita algicola]|uniref:apiosidase-like domain-containing protein n=1 Tax=Coraliomargarita algicola TaxID=3092156 RepID=UPI0031F2FEDA
MARSSATSQFGSKISADLWGESFFWMADTAWELLHRLDYAESVHYLKTRRDQGFNVVQTVILAELDGLQVPNCNGDLPLYELDPRQPNEAYFQHVDRVVEYANELGIQVALLPTWGDKFNLKWGGGPEIFNIDNSEAFGHFLGQRYKEASVVWVLGGDRIPETPEHTAIIEAMVQGLQAGDGGRHLMTYHPYGGQSSSNFFHDADWLDFNMHQSGHHQKAYPNFKATLADVQREPAKPALDGEPCYEDIAIAFKKQNGYFDAFDIRRAAYWSVLAGALGHTYGHHSIWQMWTPEIPGAIQPRTPWSEALFYPGAYEMGYMKAFFCALPWTELRPTESILIEGPKEGPDTIRVAASLDGNIVVAYTPFGAHFSLKLSEVPSVGYWFNPRNATRIPLAKLPAMSGIHRFRPPADIAEGNDWVLVIQS